jgi:transposase
LVLDQGYTISQAGVSLGVGETAIRRWIDQLAEERDGVTPKGKALTLEQRRIQELEARCERLEREKSILKKVWSGTPAALLMSDEMNRTR